MPVRDKKIPTPLLWLSHLALPGIFLYVAYIAIWKSYEITWELIVVLALASMPFILVLLARYVKKIKIGNHEYEAPEEEELSKEDVTRLAAESPKTEEKNLKYGDLSRHAKKVIRTLWTFQRQHFGAQDARRWGFGIHPSAPDYPQFRIGATELLEVGLTVENGKGMVFLNDAGMEFCRTNKNVIDGGGDIWSSFSAA